MVKNPRKPNKRGAGKDVMTPEQRSRCMSRIRGKDTGPELLLRKALWHTGFRYRLYAKLPGKPDLVFLRKKLAVFVDGCFWHGCPLHATRPKGNRPFWDRKLTGNVIRDRKITATLESTGWIVMRFWEHEVTDDIDNVVDQIRAYIEQTE